MSAKTAQLQIRVTSQQKAALKRLARAAGCDVSTYVLSRSLTDGRDRVREILRAGRDAQTWRFALAELNDFLAQCPPMEFSDAVEDVDLSSFTPYQQNYIAAMVELAAASKRLAPPRWVQDVEPLSAPQFATPLKSLRPHLLRGAPVPFKRRNIFVDASVGARI